MDEWIKNVIDTEINIIYTYIKKDDILGKDKGSRLEGEVGMMETKSIKLSLCSQELVM